MECLGVVHFRIDSTLSHVRNVVLGNESDVFIQVAHHMRIHFRNFNHVLFAKSFVDESLRVLKAIFDVDLSVDLAGAGVSLASMEAFYFGTSVVIESKVDFNTNIWRRYNILLAHLFEAIFRAVLHIYILLLL